MAERDHHESCARCQAWDDPLASCTCPPGWPRRAMPADPAAAGLPAGLAESLSLTLADRQELAKEDNLAHAGNYGHGGLSPEASAGIAMSLAADRVKAAWPAALDEVVAGLRRRPCGRCGQPGALLLGMAELDVCVGCLEAMHREEVMDEVLAPFERMVADCETRSNKSVYFHVGRHLRAMLDQVRAGGGRGE